MKTKRTLAKQSVFYGAANGIEALVPFLLAPILTRLLDPSEYGIWVLFITYATFLRPFIGLSAQDAIRMRFYDFDQKELDQYTHTLLFLMTVVMAGCAVVTYLLQDSLAPITKFPAIWLVSIVGAAFLFEVFYTILALNQFHGRRMAFLYAQIMQAVLSMVFILIFLHFDFGWQGVILGRMLSMAITIIISLHFLGYKILRLIRLPERAFYRDISLFGVSYVPSGMIIMAMPMIDKVVAAHFIDVAASALYGVAALFASAFWVVNNSFLLAWTPWLFRRLRGDEPNKLREILSVSGLYFAVSTYAAGVIYIMSIWIAPILLGEAFHTAIPLMRFMMIAILLQGFYMHNMKFLHSYKKVKTMSLCSALALGINMWLSIAWAPELGVKGIMQATIVSFAVVFVISGVITILHVRKSNEEATSNA